ncbi:hypothetical protein Esi_0131_0021 [Ectocarpus siliculosus]|uniref:IQ calmodulin-binding motif family protein n=1 Tax=Ectocarpus siliculosus TaxID=2880 RepID=D8LEG7_ECTSI|nr:hypothetical protein Esi_0131_0021 [Ectocarpus siliculosus]|eukprot:CBN80210.1 hypothetical protein Esi_0131_0021 [Ectocarpus siliculosus]
MDLWQRGMEASRLTAAQHHRANSQRSLQDMTRDWRNDPFSTPARRRRLINDVCKVIVRTYTHASVLRVVGLRREERYATRIQAAFRMSWARRLFCAKLEARRVNAALVLQLGWLSCAARRRVRVLREARDHDRRVEEGRRKRREDHERRERSRRREEQRERERKATEKRQRELESTVVLQRRFRARQELLVALTQARRRLTQAQRLRDEQHREATAMMQATTVIQAAFRRHQRRRRRREEQEHKQRRARDKAAVERLASARLQQAWRRYKAANELNRRRRRELETSGLRSSTTDEDATEHRTEGASSTSLCSNEGHPDPKDEDPNISKKSVRQEMSGDVNEGASGWDNWSSAFGVNSSLAAEIAREGETDNAAAENVRPWTSTGAAESPAPPRSRHHHPKAPPPAGMMTVTVRRGSEETSLVTPIVLTESGGEEMDAETTRKSEVGTALATADVTVVTAFSSTLGSDESGGTRPRAATVADKAVRVAEAKGAAPPAHADAPKARREQPERTKLSASATAASEITKPANPAPNQDADDAAVAGKISQILSTTAPQIANEEATAVPAMVPVAPVMKGTAASEGDPPMMTVSTPMTEPAEEAARDVVVKPTEQLFMEDTQVYLGCGMCGVKYLVEAVDPGVSKSTQGQPTPEVLYLCTTCGATLRNNGENGRWKRRRRPSSAPAAGRRRGSAFSVGGRDGGARANNEYGPPPGNGWNGDRAAALVESPSVVESLQQALHTGGGRRQGENDSATRLRYAHCAKAIQHAYQNFRHRQYLRDWAFSLVQSRRRAKHCLRCRRATVMLQSAARAMSARRRCSTLRAARLRLWTDRVAAVYVNGGDEYSPSPVAAELLCELERLTTPLPRPPGLSPTLASQPAAVVKARGGLRANVACGRSRGRALAEALAPRMERPPPGCPAALDVDWGEWGVGLRLAFPSSPRVG